MILLLVGGPPHGENLADDGEADLLRDRLRLSVVKMATAEGRAPLLLARLALASVDRFLFLMRLTPFWFAQAGRRAAWRSPRPSSRASPIWHSTAQVCLHGFAFDLVLYVPPSYLYPLQIHIWSIVN
jgi:hypothetical protein